MSDGSFFTRVEKKPRSVESKRLRTRVKITEHAIAENNASLDTAGQAVNFCITAKPLEEIHYFNFYFNKS